MTQICNLAQMLKVSAAQHEKRTALIYGQRKVSYRSLDEQSDNLSASLIGDLKIEKGQRVALLLFNRPEFVISYFGILKAGAVIVPVNTMLKTDEIKYMLEDSGAIALITSPSFLYTAFELRTRVESLRNIILVSRKKTQETIDFHSLLDKKPKNNRIGQIARDDTAVIMYTSGTTGRPKGAELTHYNLVSNAKSSSCAIKISVKDHFVCVLPLFHSFAATVCMLLPIFCGSKVTIFVSPRPFKRILRTIIRKRVTVFTGIPSMFNILKDAKLPRMLTAPLVSRIINPLRLCISGAAALPVDTLARFEKKFKVPLIEGYGLTEASPVVSLNPLKGMRKPGSIGLALPDVQVRAVDKTDKEVPIGEVGELLVKGLNVMKGYLNQPQANIETLKNGWLYTGDLAKLDADGYIYIVGRKKEMVNVRGLNVYPKEIEDALYEHPLVKEAAVIRIPDKHKGEVPKAFVVLKEESQVTSHKSQNDIEHELLSYLRERLASYKIPKYIEIRQFLPKNATGKILKRNMQ